MSVQASHKWSNKRRKEKTTILLHENYDRRIIGGCSVLGSYDERSVQRLLAKNFVIIIIVISNSYVYCWSPKECVGGISDCVLVLSTQMDPAAHPLVYIALVSRFLRHPTGGDAGVYS